MDEEGNQVTVRGVPRPISLRQITASFKIVSERSVGACPHRARDVSYMQHMWKNQERVMNHIYKISQYCKSMQMYFRKC